MFHILKHYPVDNINFMARRRKNQPNLSSLSYVAQFLNHCCRQEGITQAKLAHEINTSTATLSRWFRDELKPSDDELSKIARVINIPVENFWALKVLDNLGPKSPMIATSGAFYFLASAKTKNILMSGITMLAGVVHLREVYLKNKTLFLRILDSTRNKFSKKNNLLNMNKLDGIEVFQNTVNEILSISKKKNKNFVAQIKYTDNPFFFRNHSIGYIVGNDWIAIESHTNNQSFRVLFYDQMRWKNIIESIYKG